MIVKKILALTACVLVFQLGASAQQDSATTIPIGFNPQFSYRMLEPMQDLRKVNILLEERQKGSISNDQSLNIGASLIALLDYQNSNIDGKFSYLMRHPTPSNQIGDEVTEATLHSFQVGLTGTVNSWLAAHAELLYDPNQSFGSGTITALNRNQVQLRKGFFLFGNLNKFPVYAAIGKMDTPFGQMGTVSPFTNTTTWHAFGGLAYGAQVGFKLYNIHAAFMSVQGGTQFRGLSTPVGNGTNIPSKLNNFVADLNYTLNIGTNSFIRGGGSYMLGSAYNHSFPVAHFNPGKYKNPAYSAYGKVSLRDRLIIQGSYVKTLKVWEGTHNPIPPLNIYPASKVTAFDAGAKYQLNSREGVRYIISGEFSKFIAGPEGSPWERQNQYILGFNCLLKNSTKLFFEAFRTEGYVPLNFVSGVIPNAEKGETESTTHSERDAMSYGFILGGQLTF